MPALPPSLLFRAPWFGKHLPALHSVCSGRVRKGQLDLTRFATKRLDKAFRDAAGDLRLRLCGAPGSNIRADKNDPVVRELSKTALDVSLFSEVRVHESSRGAGDIHVDGGD